MEAIQYSTVSEKGLVVIPKSIRDRWGLKKGDRVAFLASGGRVTLLPVTQGDPITAAAGFLAPARFTMQDILEEKRAELEEEERGLPPPRRPERRVADDATDFDASRG